MPIHPHPIHRRAVVPALLLAAALAACQDSPAEPAAHDCGGDGLALEVGEALELTGRPECALRATEGASYALAYFETSRVTQAKTERETTLPGDGFVVTVTDLAGAPGGTSAAARNHVHPLADGTAAADVRLSMGTEPPAGLQGDGQLTGDVPWKAGDALQVPATCQGCSPRTATVRRVENGWLVLALVESELGPAAQAVLARWDQAAPLILQHSLPAMRSSLIDVLPVSTPGSGQLVVVIDNDNGGGGAITYSRVPAQQGPATHWILAEDGPRSAALLTGLLTHEITHAFQYEYLSRTPTLAGPRNVSGGVGWGVEGGAHLMVFEGLRRMLGRPLGGNIPLGAADDELEDIHEALAFSYHGLLPAGYEAGASFMRDLVLRRVAAGEDAEQAYREVMRGGMEGWYGIGEGGTRHTGLVARMRARIPDWDPSDAALTWALSAAGDDLTDAPVYQDRSWLRVWDPGDHGHAWYRDGDLTGGMGQSASARKATGSACFFYLRDTGSGMRFRMDGPATVRWMLLRIS